MKSLGLSPSDSELQDLVAEADVNKDGSIDFPGVSCKFPCFHRIPATNLESEFLNMMARTVKEGDTEEELKNAFKVFDKDGSGTISSAELRSVLQHLGENLTDEELDEMLKMADKNGDGNIDCTLPLPPHFWTWIMLTVAQTRSLCTSCPTDGQGSEQTASREGW